MWRRGIGLGVYGCIVIVVVKWIMRAEYFAVFCSHVNSRRPPTHWHDYPHELWFILVGTRCSRILDRILELPHKIHLNGKTNSKSDFSTAATETRTYLMNCKREIPTYRFYVLFSARFVWTRKARRGLCLRSYLFSTGWDLATIGNPKHGPRPISFSLKFCFCFFPVDWITVYRRSPSRRRVFKLTFNKRRHRWPTNGPTYGCTEWI